MSALGRYLPTIRYPGAAVSLRASEIYPNLSDEHNFVQILSRISYHAMLRGFNVDSNGRQRMDILDFDLTRDRIGRFLRKYTIRCWEFLLSLN